jgi:hypothetical protein
VKIRPFCDLIFDNQACAVSLEADISEEPYRSHTPSREFMPLSVPGGMRTRVLVRFSTPDLAARKSLQRIGEGQAWLYQEDHLLLLWRCNLAQEYRAANPVEDPNLPTLWKSFEQFLLDQFPETLQIVTPAWNRPYDESLWLQFIHMRGYTRPSPTGIPNVAFIKDVETRA